MVSFCMHRFLKDILDVLGLWKILAADDLCSSDSYKKVAFAERFPFWVVSRFEPFINACLQSVTVLTNNRPF